MHVVQVVGGDDGHVEPFGEVQQPRVQPLQEVQPVVALHLQVEAGEGVLRPARPLLRPGHIAVLDQLRQFGAWTPRQDDEAVGVRLQQRVVDARLVVEALQVGGGD